LFFFVFFVVFFFVVFFWFCLFCFFLFVVFFLFVLLVGLLLFVLWLCVCLVFVVLLFGLVCFWRFFFVFFFCFLVFCYFFFSGADRGPADETLRRCGALVVDQLLRGRRDLGDPGSKGPEPSRGRTAIGPIVGSSPAAHHLACDLGELLDVRLGAAARLPKTTSSAARPRARP
jgi:hypothetical protein